jgi:hypothetical protein
LVVTKRKNKMPIISISNVLASTSNNPSSISVNHPFPRHLLPMNMPVNQPLPWNVTNIDLQGHEQMYHITGTKGETPNKTLLAKVNKSSGWVEIHG